MSPGDETDLLLRQAWTALGGDPVLLDLVQLTGDGTGLLPSSTAALPAMTAAVTASTLAASVLDAARGMEAPKRVFIDREHVAVAARSEYYARSDALQEPDRMSPFFRFWMTADNRWFRVHGEYPWHRSRALEVLQCEDRHRSVKDAISRWRAEDLEDALDAAGGMGYAVRSEQEWWGHPQGRAVAALPLLQSETGAGTGRVADASRGTTGLRVLDLTRALAGPIATRTLAAWGAEVVRIDGPGLPEEPAHALRHPARQAQCRARPRRRGEQGSAGGAAGSRRPSGSGLPPRRPGSVRPRRSCSLRAPPAPQRDHLVRVGPLRPLGRPARLRLGGAVPMRDFAGRRDGRPAGRTPLPGAGPRNGISGRRGEHARTRLGPARWVTSIGAALPRANCPLAPRRGDDEPRPSAARSTSMPTG